MKYKRATVGVNDLRTRYPNIYSELHPTRNSFVEPELVTYGARMKLWWVCSAGHEYDMTPNQRSSQNQSCPYCSGHRVLKGFNDLATTHPDLVAEWSDENVVEIYEVSYGSHEPVLWECFEKHEWIVSPNQRAGYGTGCPYCSGNEVLVGFNDFESQHPELVRQWDYTKNKTKPSEITAGSDYSAYWLCAKGHEWITTVRSRARGGRGCWSCVDRTSKAEDYISSFLEDSGYLVVRNSRTILGGKELDIYLPQENLAIEFNGIYWHSDKVGYPQDTHHTKWKMCKDLDIDLLHIWEFDYEDEPGEYLSRVLDLLEGNYVTNEELVENGSLDEAYYSRNNYDVIDYMQPEGVVYNLNKRCKTISNDKTGTLATIYNAGFSRIDRTKDVRKSIEQPTPTNRQL